MDYETRVSKLIALHFSGLITECEEEELQNLLRENPTTATLFLRLREDDMFRESYLQQKKWDVEKAILKFDTLTGKKSKVLHKRFLWSCAAAVLIGILVGGTWFIKFRTERIKQPEKVLLAEKVAIYAENTHIALPQRVAVYIDHAAIGNIRGHGVTADSNGELRRLRVNWCIRIK